MLAPSSLRHGPPSGGPEQRRSRRLVAIALTCGVLAVVTPLALTSQVAGGDVAARAADAPVSAAPSTANRTVTATPSPAAAAVTIDTPTAAPTTDTPAPAPAADPVPTSAQEPASAPAEQPPAPAEQPAPVEQPAPAPAVEEPAAPAPATDEAPAEPAAANWMEALRPKVDPQGLATWVFQAHGAWGASDGHTVYIDPDVPQDKRWSVMVHEYGHVLQVRQYGSLDATAVAMSAIVGASASDKGPTESNADCIAEQLGATWTDYGCQDALRPAAAALVAGERP